MSQNFVHLHVHSVYSLLDGAARIEDLVLAAKKHGMNALALTDHGVMYGAIPFYQACRKHGIKPIIGCEMYLVDSLKNRKKQPRYHQLLLAETNQGYRNLMKLVTIAHQHMIRGRPCIDLQLLARYRTGLIATSSCMGGIIPQAILSQDLKRAEDLISTFLGMFDKEHFFFEIQGEYMKPQSQINQQLIKWANQWGISLVATNDVHYIEQADAQMHDCLLCIHTGKKLDDPERMRFPSDQYYLKSPQEMAQQFQDIPEALENTLAISDRCNLTLSFDQLMMPRYPIPPSQNASAYLWSLCERGLSKRQIERTVEVEKRLNKEYSLIHKLGYADYFLVVWDIVQFAKKQGIAVGPGRGSVAGSLIAYLLGITNINPLKYGLLFERFLNPERVTWPDIDLDFDDERRSEVLQYVHERYGEEYVAHIITFGSMAPRAAVRDVGRVLGLPYGVVDQVAKAIPSSPGVHLQQLIRQDQQFAKWNRQPELGELLQTACKIEGMPRHASTHAAGVVISPVPLVEHVPLQPGIDDVYMTQYTMESLESLGLIKIDLLGLRNLTVIERTLSLLDKLIDLSKLNYHDEKILKMLGRGETTGVFQLESSGMRKVLRECQPSSFEDLVAIIALYRPGPMEQIPHYIAAKKGQETVQYPHPDLEPILRNTYGIIVYQEQIMQIAAKMAGFRLGQADLLRRAVSKKKRDVLEEQRSIFIQGCLARGYDRQTGEKVYDLIVRFANYGFNRSHSVAYSILSYQTAYLKAYYPLAYFTALLSSVLGNQDKLMEYIEEVRRTGILLLPPDINRSQYHFTIEQGKIRFGLGAIKHLGRQSIEVIEQERENGTFQDLSDFCRRIDLRFCNRRAIEALILAGAMESLPDHRAKQLAMLGELTEPQTSNIAKNQLSLFTDEERVRGRYEQMKPYSQQELLQLEYHALGFYLTGHPLDAYDYLKNPFGLHSLAQLTKQAERTRVSMLVMMREIKMVTTRKKENMAFVQIEDQSGQIEAILFPKAFRKFDSLLRSLKGKPCYISGTVQQDEDQVRLIIDRMGSFEKPTKIFIRIHPAFEQQPEKLEELKGYLKKFRRKIPVTLYYERSKQFRSLPVDKYGLDLSAECMELMERLVGEGSLRM
ncbi:DNA polymerase-3 subunit alpha [Seinonella peptonophila]|uniref:DNA polymerase III subunit alpha n=1 Tax=Seinonella peptonophila TaxID=112248 RepID=A0A1M4W4I8_9BACL|nr:DNA polymerase III subunit alpha [Seinonella peptonophila]SHE76065.1 DNA polymerase-3 subunit alpha [Seinonella peptonophila]